MSVADRIAVMNKGTVEQFDTPVAIYDRPQTLFVNGFIGTTNLLPGKVTSVVGDIATVALDAGATLRLPAAGHRCRLVRDRVGAARAARAVAGGHRGKLADRTGPQPAARLAARARGARGRRHGAQDRRTPPTHAPAKPSAASAPSPPTPALPCSRVQRHQQRSSPMTVNRRTLLAGARRARQHVVPAHHRPCQGPAWSPRPIPAPGKTPTAPSWRRCSRRRTTSTSSWRRCSPWTRSARPRPRAARRRSTSSCSIPARASSASRAACSRSSTPRSSATSPSCRRASPTMSACMSAPRSWASPTIRRRCRRPRAGPTS